MKGKQLQAELKRVNIDLNVFHNNPHKKNRDSYGLGLHVRDSKSSAFKSILQKVYEAHSKKQKLGEGRAASIYSSKRDRLERQTIDMSLLDRRHKRLESHSLHEAMEQHGGPNTWSLLNKNHKKLVKERFIEASSSSIAVPPLPKETFQSFYAQPDQKRDINLCSIDPYTRAQYRYIENTQIDMQHKQEKSEKQHVNPAIFSTKSYKVSGIQLAPHENQKRSFDLKKALNSHQSTLSQKKFRRMNRKASDVMPWEWTEQSKLQQL